MQSSHVAVRPMSSLAVLLVLLASVNRLLSGSEPSPAGADSETGLQLRYDFATDKVELADDSSKPAESERLRVDKADSVRQSSQGLELLAPTIIRSEVLPKRLLGAIKSSGAFSISTWIRPATLQQSGPARIVTISLNTNERNFTLGQDGDRIEARLRTTKTSTNGIPALASRRAKLDKDWCYVVFSFAPSGEAKLFLNGQLDAQESLGGKLSSWDERYALAFGNELSGNRPWLGSIRSLEIYDRVFSPEEVRERYDAGRDAVTPSPEQLLAKQVAARARFFETKIAPIVSAHCLECHDSVTKQGGLDLSRMRHALSGGDSGPAIRAGEPAESIFWTRIASNEMPEDRDPLSDAEKSLIKQWIEEDAHWSLDFIDSAVYARSEQIDKVYLQRLTVPEYIETIRSVLDIDVSKEAAEILPRDVRADGFSNTAYNLTVDLAHIEAYAQLAEMVMSQVDVAKLAKQLTKSRALTDENVTKVIEPMGLRLLRGPVTKQEITYLCGVSTSVAAAGGDFEEAIRYVLETMLQSPRFIYRIEHHAGDGHPRELDPYELASRLSYIIWGGPPDDELLQAAEKDELDSGGIEQQIRRMLEDPRAMFRSRQFIAEWLNLGSLNNLRPNPERFPKWEQHLAGDMRAETLAFFEDVVWRESQPLSELLSAQWTFVTPRLARHYGLPMTDRLAKADQDQLVRYDLTDVASRGGLLTHGSVLTKGGDEASMVTRGLFVMNELLRGVVRDPPPCVDTTPKPSRPGLSQRMISEQRLASESCVGCHVKFEPLAFGLERFDGLGTYHEEDEFGNSLRDDGKILFPGDGQPIEFTSSAQLMQILSDSDRVREAFTWKVTQFAVGRPLDAADANEVSKIHAAAQKDGGTYRALITAITNSDLVRLTRTETP